MKSERNLSILIPDGENLLTIRVIQCLSEMKRVRIYVLSSRKYASVRFSRYVTRFLFDKPQDDVAWIDRINTIVKEHSIDVVMPVFETAIRKVVVHRDLLSDPYKSLTPSHLEQFENAQNKWLLYQQLQKIGVPSPRTWDLSAEGASQIDHSALEFPVLIKPKWEIQGGGKGIVKFADASELEAYLKGEFAKGPYILQEYFDGIDLGVNVICKEGQILAHTIQLGTLFDSQEFKPQIGLKMIQEKQVYAATVKLLEALNWTGVAHIDFLYDPASGKFVVLEINPRYWLTLQASLFSGVNFPKLYCLTATGQTFEHPPYKEIEYYDLKAFKSNPMLLLNPGNLWARTAFKFLLKDPLMTGYHLFWSLKNRLQRKKWIETN